MTNNLHNRAFDNALLEIKYNFVQSRPETSNYYDLTNIIIGWDHQPRLLCSIFVEDTPVKDFNIKLCPALRNVPLLCKFMVI